MNCVKKDSKNLPLDLSFVKNENRWIVLKLAHKIFVQIFSSLKNENRLSVLKMAHKILLQIFSSLRSENRLIVLKMASFASRLFQPVWIPVKMKKHFCYFLSQRNFPIRFVVQIILSSPRWGSTWQSTHKGQRSFQISCASFCKESVCCNYGQKIGQ